MMMSSTERKLSDSQTAALEKFREAVQDVLPQLPVSDHHYLLKWLRARNFNVKNAEAMLRKHVEFRVKMDVEQLVKNWKPPEVIEKYFSGGVCGFDRAGSPLWWEVVGELDPQGLMRSQPPAAFMNTKVTELEGMLQLCQEQTRRLGRQVDSMVAIMDLHNLSRKHLWRPFLESNLDILRMFEANYPECLKRVYIVRAPRIFPLVYSIVKPIISEDTRNKIRVLGGDWQQELLSEIDACELPVYYGGTRTGTLGDTRCRDKIRFPTEVPVRHYAPRDATYDDSVTVSVGATLTHTLGVTDTGSSIRWAFQTENHDIGFGVSFRRAEVAGGGGGGDEVADCVIISVQRHNTHLIPEHGSLTAQEPGVYSLIFDNSYSWVHSKKLQFTVTLVPTPEATLPSHCGDPC